LTMTANRVGGAQAAVRRPTREAVAHSAGRAQRAVGVEAALGAGVALALGARSHTRYLRPLCDPKRTLLFEQPASGQHCVFAVGFAQLLCVCEICAGAGSTAFSCSFRTTAQGCAELVACVRFPRTRCALLVDCLDLGHESRAALSGQPMHDRRRSLAAQPRVCRAVRLHNTVTSPNLTLDPLYRYMRPFGLARTVNVHSSF